MKVQLLSDLHLESHPHLFVAPAPGADLLVLAGDIGSYQQGSRLETPGRDPLVGPPDEYPDIYRTFADLLDAGTSQVDAAPFQLLADAFMIGARDAVAPFTF